MTEPRPSSAPADPLIIDRQVLWDFNSTDGEVLRNAVADIALSFERDFSILLNSTR
jgi:hypothetical protein